jgi:hypothetical protein
VAGGWDGAFTGTSLFTHKSIEVGGCLLWRAQRTQVRPRAMSEKCRYCCRSLFGVANENSKGR